jgi:hypothetical protein
MRHVSVGPKSSAGLQFCPEIVHDVTVVCGGRRDEGEATALAEVRGVAPCHVRTQLIGKCNLGSEL